VKPDFKLLSSSLKLPPHSSVLIGKLIRFNFLVLLAGGVSLFGIFVWVASASKADFWADDFSNMTKFGRTLGPILDTDGKLIINFYWFIGSYFFGTGSVIPYLLLNFSVFIGSIFILNKVAHSRGWDKSFPLLILASLFGSGTIYAFLTWSSNIVHLASLFGFSCALYLQELIRKSPSKKFTLELASVMGLVWTFATLSNPLYIAFLFLGLYFTYEQYRIHAPIRDFNFLLGLVFLNLLLPILGFIFLSYPRVTKQSAYDISGNQFIIDNAKFYLAPFISIPFLGLLLICSLAIVAIALLLETRNKNYVPLILFTTVVGLIYPILVQGQQRGIHYFSIPIILLVCSIYSMRLTQLFLFHHLFIRFLSRITIGVLIVLLVAGSYWTRIWYTTTPFGQPLTQLRGEISQFVTPTNSICLRFKMPVQDRNFVIGGMGGRSGFVLPPINAVAVHFEHLNECVHSADTHIDVRLSFNNSYHAKLGVGP
jgi:hypothetical protein